MSYNVQPLRDQKDMKEAVTLMQPCKTEKDKEGLTRISAEFTKFTRVKHDHSVSETLGSQETTTDDHPQ